MRASLPITPGRILSTRLGRYIVVGAVVYAIEVSIILGAQYLGFTSVLAVGFSFWVGLIISFLLQKLIAFNDKRMHRRILMSQMIAFTALVMFNFLFTIAITGLLAKVLVPVITRTLALSITTLWNFYLYKTRIFNTSDTIPVD